MPDSTTLLSIAIGLMLAGGLYYLYFMQGKPKSVEAPVRTGSNSLQLQAYERLTLLVDRITIPNLVSRTNHEGLSARDMQLILTKSIRDEFDYNITQQIYITPETWNAVKGLKEKNLLIINQISAALPINATALDLNRALLEFLMTDNKANLPELVSEALSYEAKKLL